MKSRKITAPIDMEEDEDVEDEVEEVEDETKLDEVIDMSLAVLPLADTEQKLMLKIIEAPTKEELQKQFELFNINQSKKNAIRIVKLNNLLSMVEDQAIQRIEKRPDQIGHKELIEYMNVVSNQIDRAQKAVDIMKDSPAIMITNQKNEVNINVGPQLDRDSKERVKDVLGILINQINKNSQIIDAKFTAHKSETDMLDEAKLKVDDDNVVDIDVEEDNLKEEEN